MVYQLYDRELNEFLLMVLVSISLHITHSLNQTLLTFDEHIKDIKI